MISRMKTWIAGLSKRGLFLLFLSVAGAVALALSLAARLTVDRPSDRPVRLAAVAPISGQNQTIGRAIVEGAELFVRQINRAGGINGATVELVAIDDADSPETAKLAAEKAVAAGVVGVVGHWSAASVAAAAPIYTAAKIPVLAVAPPPVAAVPAAAPPAGPSTEPAWLFHKAYDQSFETKFLANYVRNVLGEKIVTIIQQEGADNAAMAQTFDEVLQRFGTKVLNRLTFDPASPAVADELTAIAQNMRDQRVSGAVFILADPKPAALTLAILRKSGLRNRAVGLRSLATSAFTDAYAAAWNEQNVPATGTGAPVFATANAGLNGAYNVTPLLFDTAGELAQNFRSDFVKLHRRAPDWVAASGFDAARILLRELTQRTPKRALNASVEELRLRVRDGLGAAGKSFHSLFGTLTFNAAGVAAPAALMGVYDGGSLISALTQLSPIREENVGNYLDELVAGKALYVNDRFMYKTNVVYTGVNIEKIANFDPGVGTSEVTASIWFRWRGDFQPQDVIFTNSLQPIKLEKPERVVQTGDMTYHMYRIKGIFYNNYSSAERPYGAHVVGLTFRHRFLARNNLMYVSDVLGMNISGATTLNDAVSTSLANGAFEGRVAGELAALAETFGISNLSFGGGGTDALAQMMVRVRALAGAPGWTVGRAWISQDTFDRISEGDPAFVGFGKPQSYFSQIDMGAMLKTDDIDFRDYIPSSGFLYIAIVAFVGSVLASLLDRKDRGQFWRMQTLGLRLVCWPLLLLSVGNLTLDYALQNIPAGGVSTIESTYLVLCWLVPARLATISLERFIWAPLEIRAQRKIPNVIRMATALVVYLFAIFGVIAYVYGKPVTSLLATSGLMAMIIGLAIQANIANIFSGIILNIERPFKVGDYIKINAGVMGEVIDITWRTVRIRHLEGQLVCLANSKISEAEVHNFSDVGNNFVRLALYVDPAHDPKMISRLVNETLGKFDYFTNLASNYFGPDCQFKGMECVNGDWTARYRLKFYLLKGNDENKVVNDVLAAIWDAFSKAGVNWTPANKIESLTADAESAVLQPVAS